MNGQHYIHNERHRQVDVEGWSESNDDKYTSGQLLAAARCYQDPDATPGTTHPEWPWDSTWWKPAGRIRNLVKAGALYLAEADRLDRAHASTEKVLLMHDLAMKCAEYIDDIEAAPDA